MPGSLILGRAFANQPLSAFRLPTDGGRKTPPPILLAGGEPVHLDPPSHALTIAPPNGNKAGAVILPNLLMYPGPVVVIDPTGAYYEATARERGELGAVVRLDPFRVVGDGTDAINPLELIRPDGPDVESDCQLVADLVSPRLSLGDSWEIRAFGLLSAIVGYVHVVPEKNNKFSEVIKTFASDDVVYNLAVVLDTIGKRLSPLAYNEIAAFLQGSESERTRTLSTATLHHKALLSQEVARTLDDPSMALDEFQQGNPFTAYLMIPPSKLRSHAAVLRIWLGTLVHCVMDRGASPAVAPLFLLDEAAQLGHFPLLETAMTAYRGDRFRIWTFWDCLSQLRHLYLDAWPSMVRGCGAIQVFSDRDYTAAAEAASLLGLETEDLLDLGPDEQVVRIDGICQRIKKIDYFTDPLFADRTRPDFSDNPGAV